MNKLEELFDSVVLLTVRFPITLLRLLVRPSSAFDRARNCSPGAFFTISFLLGIVLLKTLPQLERFSIPLPESTLLIVVITYNTFIILVQRLLLTLAFGSQTDQDELLKALFYPLSVLYLVHSLLLPFIPRLLLARSYSDFWLLVAGSHVIYAWALFGFSLGYLRYPVIKAIASTVVALFAYSIVLLTLGASTYFLLG